MPEKIYIIKRKINATLCGLLYHCFGIFPIRKNKIVFSAFEGSGFCCNPKYIALELIRRQNDQKEPYEMVWLVNDLSKEFPSEIKKAKNTLWNRAYHLSTSHVWVDNARKGFETKKRKGQFYILTWHGPIGFKPSGRLRGEKFSKIAEMISMHDADMVDALLSNSDWCTEKWEKSFWNEPILKYGSPRCDILIKEREKCYREIRQKYHLPIDTKIVMYAPTFRGGSQRKKRSIFSLKSTIDFCGLLSSLEKKFGGSWCVFIRQHPQIALQLSTHNYKTTIDYIDVSNEDDLYEILAGIDVFLSDYSSAAFDASFMRIPVFLYVEDMEQYITDRGSLVWKIEEIPFPMSKNNKELIDQILQFQMDTYVAKLNKMFEDMNLLEDGLSSKRWADLIERVITK